MGIWVRSQDKKTLCNVEKLSIERKTDYVGGMKTTKHKIIDLTLSGVNYGLGTYDTEKRALDVLDDIQKTISENEAFKMGCRKADNGRELQYNHVYIMPEE